MPLRQFVLTAALAGLLAAEVASHAVGAQKGGMDETGNMITPSARSPPVASNSPISAVGRRRRSRPSASLRAIRVSQVDKRDSPRKLARFAAART